MIETFLGITVLVCLGYLLLTNLTYVALVVVAFVENGVRRHEEASQDFDVLGESRFTIPVSVIVAAYNEESAIVSTVESLLDLDYPEFEVIAVNDGSSDATLARLVDAFELEPYEVFVRHVFPTENVRAIYRGRVHPNLVVLDKENGGKSDALNAGLNVARFRYVCGVDADTVFDREALLKGMRRVVEDAGSHHRGHEPPDHRREPRERHARLSGTAADRPATLHGLPAPRLPACVLQQPARVVAPGLHALCGRRRFRSGDGTSSRRSAATRARSRARTSSSPSGCTRNSPASSATTRSTACRTTSAPPRGPTRFGSSSPSASAGSVSSTRPCGTTAGCGSASATEAVGLIGAPFFLFTEVLAPAFELLAIVTFAVAVALGLFDPAVFAVMLVAIAFLTGALTACAILLDDLQSRTYRIRDLVRMLLLAPLDLVLYRPVIVWARLKGTWRFLRGDKAWHKFERNVRAPA